MIKSMLIAGEASTYLTVFGLLLDIVGAALLAKGLFFENFKESVDKAYIDTRGKALEFYGIDRLKRRCDEIKLTRLGLALLLSGFILQIIGVCVQGIDFNLSGGFKIGFLIVVVLVTLMGFFLLSHFDERHRRRTVIELVLRTRCSFSKDGILLLPAGFDGCIIDKFLEAMLTRKLPYNKETSKKDQMPQTWLLQEMERRDQKIKSM